VTQWVQAKLDKLVTSLSQLLINYYRYRVKMNVHHDEYYDITENWGPIFKKS